MIRLNLRRRTLMAEISVRNPVALTATPNEPPVPRAGSLQNGTLGLWWNHKPGGEVFLEHVGETLASRHGVSLHRQYQNFPSPPQAFEEVVREANVVVGATGD
jgi:hypothetical protein